MTDPRPPIACSTISVFSKPLDDAFPLIAETGFDGIELQCSHSSIVRGFVGAPLVVVHPPYRWQKAYRSWVDERLSAVAAERGVRIAVENMFPLRVRGRSIARFHARQSLEDLEGFPDVTLDTSHLAVAGLDPVETLSRLGDRLAHVHLSNNACNGWDSHLPLDQGVLDLGRFLEALATRGFEGAISLEIDLRSHLDDEQALRRILSRNRELCESGLALPA